MTLTANQLVLQPDDFIDDAARLGCSIAAIRAVAFVESYGGGFCPDLFPKTLFEGHYFSRLTKGKYDKSHPTISFPKWTPETKKFYGKGWQAERARLDLACTLDRTAALQSASWGTFQVMGANHAVCGFKTVQQFVNAMCKDSNAHLDAFTTFVLESGLDDELRDLRWADFARKYNGPGYAANKYDVKMAQAYDKFNK
jgi:hypothetical protein